MEILDLKVSRSPVTEQSRQSKDHGPRAGVIRKSDDLGEAGTLRPGCRPAEPAVWAAAPLQGQHKRLRLSEEVKRRLLELSVGSCLSGQASTTCYVN